MTPLRTVADIQQGYVITRVRSLLLGYVASVFGSHREMTAMAMTETVAAAAEQAAESSGGRFWCHECNAQVPTSLDEASAEVCCNNCGGNFVEEIDEVNDAQTARKIGVGYADMQWC